MLTRLRVGNPIRNAHHVEDSRFSKGGELLGPATARGPAKEVSTHYLREYILISTVTKKSGI